MRMVLGAFLIVLAAGEQSGAATQCLSRADQRSAIASGRAVTLAAAQRAARERVKGDIIGARLCESAKGLRYRLTILGRDGKVARVVIDAATGSVLKLDGGKEVQGGQ